MYVRRLVVYLVHWMCCLHGDIMNHTYYYCGFLRTVAKRRMTRSIVGEGKQSKHVYRNVIVCLHILIIGSGRRYKWLR